MKFKNQYRGGKGIKSFEDIVGTTVGKLDILKYSYSEPNKQGVGNHHYYNCICLCGNKCIIKRKSLLKKEILSCGCLRKETATKTCITRSRPNLQTLEDKIYYAHKNQAIYRGLEFNIDKDLHKKLILDNCHYCGRLPSNLFKREKHTETLSYNGMDRKEGNIGYVKSNLVTCCIKCNKAKNTMNYKEFKEYIKDLIDFNKNDSGEI